MPDIFLRDKILPVAIALPGQVPGLPRATSRIRADVRHSLRFVEEPYNRARLLIGVWLTAVGAPKEHHQALPRPPRDVEPDILIVDEVLAVGDEKFQARCHARMHDIQASGCTILFVSHDMGTVQRLYGRVLVLHHGGACVRWGAEAVIARYRELQGWTPEAG